MIGCKNGCLCNDINKELCCIECEEFSTLKEIYYLIARGHLRLNKIIYLLRLKEEF